MARTQQHGRCDAIGIRDIVVQFANGSHITMQNLGHVPQLCHSLMYVYQLVDIGYNVILVC